MPLLPLNRQSLRSIIPIIAVSLFLMPLPALALTVEKVVSPKGIEAWLVQDHANPIVALELSIQGGASLDPANKAGLATMAASLLDEGAGPYDSQGFQKILEDKVITLNFDAGQDAIHGHVKTLTANRDLTFDLLRLALTQPRFDKEPVERIRGQLLTLLTREEQTPSAVASRRWTQVMFPAHPYGRSPRGDLTSIKAIQKGDLSAFMHEHVARDRLTIGVVGDITPAELGPLLDSTFGALPAPRPAPPVAEARPAVTGGVTVIDRAIPQTVAVFGLPGIKRDDPDWYPAYVMNYILGGGGFSSRLTEEVREKRGLAYSVYTHLAPYRHGGIIMGGVATENGRFAQSLELIRGELKRMAESGPTAEELADAKTYLNGSFPLQLESTEAIAALLVQLQTDHLGMDFLDRRAALIDAVTLDDARRAAARLLRPESLSVVAVGHPAGL